MALREEFAEVGAFLFRWRSYLPLVVLAIVLSQMGDFPYSETGRADELAWQALCFAVAVLGLVIRGYVAGHAPRGTTGRNTRAQMCESLNTTGAYSVVRHPMYVGNFFTWLGVSMFPHKWWLVVLVALVFWLYYERIMYAEEEFLRNKFGQSFVEWAARTPAFLPNFRLYQKPSLPFSIRAFLRREFSGHFGVIAVFTILALTGDWMVERQLVLDPLWVAICVTGAVVYLTCLLIKKQTDWLEVEGR